MRFETVAVVLAAACAHGCADVPQAPPSGASSTVASLQAEPTSGITVTPGPVTGTGCAEGTYFAQDYVLPGGGRVFQINTIKYRLSSDDKPAIQQQSCDLQFNVVAKPGTRFALSRVQFVGSAILQPGARAQVQLSYGFAKVANLPPRTKSVSFEGPRGIDDSSEWNFPDDEYEPLQFSPCGAARVVELKTKLTLLDRKRTPGSLVTFEEASVTLDQDPSTPQDKGGVATIEFVEQSCP